MIFALATPPAICYTPAAFQRVQGAGFRTREKR